MIPGYAILTASALLLAACTGVTAAGGPEPERRYDPVRNRPGYCQHAAHGPRRTEPVERPLLPND